MKLGKVVRKIGGLIFLPIILFVCCSILVFNNARKMFGLTNEEKEDWKWEKEKILEESKDLCAYFIP